MDAYVGVMDWSNTLRFSLHVGIVAVIVFVALYVFVFDLPSTGFLIFDKNVSLSVQQTQDGEISQFGFDQRVEIGESVNVSLELANRGSIPISSTYDLEVYDVNNSLLYTYPGSSKTLQPGVFMNREIKHTPHNTGVYIIRLQAVMGGSTLQTAQFLLVSEPPEEPEPEPIVITRKRIRYVYGPEPPEPPGPLPRSWQIEAPRSIDLGQGQSTTVPIRITNTGEAFIENIQLSLRSSQNITVDFTPKILFGVPSNTTRNFVLNIESDPALRYDQNISFTVNSEKLSQSGETDINIVPTMTIVQLQKEIEKLQLLVQDAKDEASEMEAAGVDVGDAKTDLQSAETLISEAQKNIEDEELEAASNRLNDARENIGDVFQKLFKKRSEQLVVTAPLVHPVYLLIGASILVAIFMVGGYYYIKEHHNERPKLLRDMEEAGV